MSNEGYFPTDSELEDLQQGYDWSDPLGVNRAKLPSLDDPNYLDQLRARGIEPDFLDRTLHYFHQMGAFNDTSSLPDALRKGAMIGLGLPKNAVDIGASELTGQPSIQPIENRVTDALFPANGPKRGYSAFLGPTVPISPETENIENALLRSGSKVATRFATDPLTYTGLGLAGKPGIIGSTLLGAEAAGSGGEALGRAVSAYEGGNTPGAIESGVEGLTSLGMAAGAFGHGLHEGSELPVSRTNPEIVWNKPESSFKALDNPVDPIRAEELHNLVEKVNDSYLDPKKNPLEPEANFSDLPDALTYRKLLGGLGETNSEYVPETPLPPVKQLNTRSEYNSARAELAGIDKEVADFNDSTPREVHLDKNDPRLVRATELDRQIYDYENRFPPVEPISAKEAIGVAGRFNPLTGWAVPDSWLPREMTSERSVTPSGPEEGAFKPVKPLTPIEQEVAKKYNLTDPGEIKEAAYWENKRKLESGLPVEPTETRDPLGATLEDYSTDADFSPLAGRTRERGSFDPLGKHPSKLDQAIESGQGQFKPVLSEPAKVLNELLKAGKMTRFNQATVIQGFEKAGIPLSDDLKSMLPGVLDELKANGNIRELSGGTYTLQSGAPKRYSVPEVTPETGPSLEDQLKASIENHPDIQALKDEIMAKPVSAMGVAETSKPVSPIDQESSSTATRPDRALASEIEKTNQKFIKEVDRQQFQDAVNEAKQTKNYAKAIDVINKAQGIEAARNFAKKVRESKQADQAQANLVTKITSAQNAEEVSNRQAAEKNRIDLEKQQATLQDKISKAQNVEELQKLKVQARENQAQIRMIDKISKEQAKEEIANRKSITLKSESDPSEGSLLEDLTDLPKTLKSAFDVSFPGRQGLFLLNRPEGLKGVVKGTAGGLSEKLHLANEADLNSRPNSELYKKFGLNQVKYDPTEPSSLSEQFPVFKGEQGSKFGQAVQKIPGLKQSERMFNDAGNLMRANVFDSLTEKWSKAGKTPETRPDLYYGLSKYLNVLTGRDPLPVKLQKAGYILNKAFWSPQFVKSRMQMLNPVFYARLPREVQLEAIRDVGGTISTMALIASATAAALKEQGVDAKFETDPTHTNFGKLVVGKSKYDLFSSLGPMVRTAARIAESKKTTPGGTYRLQGGFGLGNTEGLPPAPMGQSAGGELGNFVENKAAPAYQIGKGVLTGKNYYGEPYDIPSFLDDLATPMSVGGIIQAWHDYDAEEGAKNIPDLFGISTQTEHVKRDAEGNPVTPKAKGHSKGSKKTAKVYRF